MKSIVKFLEASFNVRYRITVMEDDPFVRKDNLTKLEIQPVSGPQTGDLKLKENKG